MNIKRLFLIIIPVIMVFTLSLSGCSQKVDRTKELEEALSTIEDELGETFDSEEPCDFSLLCDYLSSWAKTCELKVKKNSTHYIVLSNPATKNCKNKKSATMQCSIDTETPENSFYVLSTAMASLLGPEEHGTIDLIVTEYSNDQRIGAESVDKSFLDSSNFINLQNAKNSAVYTNGAYSATDLITSSAKKTSPSYTEAYTITFSMPEYTDPYNYEKKSNYPNPIEIVGGVLAKAKSAGKLFNIASFSCKVHDGYTPYSASATIVIDKNNVESIKNKFENSYEKMTKKFKKLDDQFVYSMTKSSLPSKVLSEKSANNLISLMYTLNTGICYQDEDTGVISAASYISNVSTKDGNLELSLRIRARSQESLDELTEEYNTTAGLCSTKCSQKEPGRVWTSKEGSGLAEFFQPLITEEEDSSDIAIKTYDNDFFAKKNSSLNIITYTFSNKDKKTALSNLINFLNPNYEAEESQTE